MPIIYHLNTKDGKMFTWMIIGNGNMLHILETSFTNDLYCEKYTIDRHDLYPWIPNRLRELQVTSYFEKKVEYPDLD